MLVLAFNLGEWTHALSDFRGVYVWEKEIGEGGESESESKRETMNVNSSAQNVE